MYFSRSDMLWTIGSLCQVFHVPSVRIWSASNSRRPIPMCHCSMPYELLDFKVGEVKLGADAEVAC